MRWALRRVELLADGLEGSSVFIVTVNIAQQAAQLVEGRRIDPRAVFLDAVLCPRPELFYIPTCLRYSDNRHIKVSAFHHRLKCRKNLFVSQVPGRTEKDERIRMRNVHSCSLFRGFFQMTAETKAHGRKQPVGVIGFATR